MLILITDKCKYFDYGAWFGASVSFLLSNGSGFGRYVIIFGTDMSSLVHNDTKKNDILIFGKGPTNGLDYTTLTAEK